MTGTQLHHRIYKMGALHNLGVPYQLMIGVANPVGTTCVVIYTIGGDGSRTYSSLAASGSPATSNPSRPLAADVNGLQLQMSSIQVLTSGASSDPLSQGDAKCTLNCLRTLNTQCVHCGVSAPHDGMLLEVASTCQAAALWNV